MDPFILIVVIAVSIIAAFNYYMALARDLWFKKRRGKNPPDTGHSKRQHRTRSQA